MPGNGSIEIVVLPDIILLQPVDRSIAFTVYVPTVDCTPKSIADPVPGTTAPTGVIPKNN
jgi:hypothetical protein